MRSHADCHDIFQRGQAMSESAIVVLVAGLVAIYYHHKAKGLESEAESLRAQLREAGLTPTMHPREKRDASALRQLP